MSAATPFKARAGGTSWLSWRIGLALSILVMCLAAIAISAVQFTLGTARGDFGVAVIASTAQYDKFCTLQQYGAPEKERKPLLNAMSWKKVVEFRRFVNGDLQRMPYAGNDAPCDGWAPEYDYSDSISLITRLSTALKATWGLFALAAIASVFCLFRVGRND